MVYVYNTWSPLVFFTSFETSEVGSVLLAASTSSSVVDNFAVASSLEGSSLTSVSKGFSSMMELGV